MTLDSSQLPGISGRPVIDGPKILDWPSDRQGQGPSLDEPTANLINDLHAEMSDCDMVLTTSGNYHMALRELWDIYLESFPADAPLGNWFYTTSPPVARGQIANGLIRFGNFRGRCRPQVAVGPAELAASLVAAGLTDGGALPICKSRGNVILVKRRNPGKILTVWDLGRKGIRLITPNPETEQGSFRLYAVSIYRIAQNDKKPPSGMTAEGLFNAIFNGKRGGQKWFSGRRIHHREIPWSVAYGKADAGLIFYHLAKHAKNVFPELFDIVPLGGTADEPKPLPGNQVETLCAVRIRGDWSKRQKDAAEKLMELFKSRKFTAILKRHGLEVSSPWP